MRRRLALVLLVAALLFCDGGVQASQDFIWREAETADEANFTIQTAEGDPAVLSGGRWVHESLEGNAQFQQELGAGRRLAYKMPLTQAGRYNLWFRLGYETERPVFFWRVDNGDWREINPSALTTGLTALSSSCALGWARAGELDLSAGMHTIELKADKPNGNRFLFGLDAVALAKTDWLPEGTLKPGEAPASALDRRAAAQVYALPGGASPDRTELSLNGPWEVCRYDDPDMDRGTYEPLRELPARPVWRGIEVPSALNDNPALNLAHRVWYRCRVEVPGSYDGRSFLLDFAGTNWIASVVVNGSFVGSHRSTRVPWQLDITRAIRPGKTNEILVGIKDPWYGIDAAAVKKTLDQTRHISVDGFRDLRFVGPIFPSTKGDADGTRGGITDPVRLIAAGGPVYVADVFVKTTVTDRTNAQNNKTITAEVTLANPTDRAVEAVVGAEAVFARSGQSEKRLEPIAVTVPAGGRAMAVLTAPWPEAKLWWPEDDPAALYDLHTAVSVGGKAADRHVQRFGFREVKIDGIYVRLNGLRRNFWNLLAGFSGATPEEALAHFRKGNNRFERFGADLELGRWFPTRREQLAWTDAHGIPGRLSTMIDGMFITHDLKNPFVWENFAEHVEQVVRAYRNHPSVIVYSLENELLYITGALGFADILDAVEAKAKQYLIETARRLDPTRPSMLDGGGGLRDQSADICNTHYAEDGFHPDNAFPLDAIMSQGRWMWNKKKPYAAGEIAYFSGNNADHAWIGGESAAVSKAGARQAYAKYLRYLFERYRWNAVAMIFPWTGMDGSEDCRNAMSPLAAFTREYNANFFGGEAVTRTIKVFNDTFSTNPVAFSWSVEVAGRRVAGKSETLQIEPGFAKQLTVSFTAPAVMERTPAKFILEVAQEGSAPFRDVKDYVFFPRLKTVAVKRPVYLYGAKASFAKSLAKLGVKAIPLAKISQAAPRGILLVAPELFEPGQSVDGFIDYAKAGGRVIVLEQTHPTVGTSFGMPLLLASNLERKAYGADFNFALGAGAPLLKGLGEADLSCWAGDAPTTRNVWGRPAGGNARSWIGCGPGLTGSSLLEFPLGNGVFVATQMRIGTKLEIEPAAQVLFGNILQLCDTYQKPTAKVGLYAPDRPAVAEFVDLMGLHVVPQTSLTRALDAKTTPILIVGASAKTLAQLNREKAAVDRYVQGGGWIMLWGLEPDGLQAYNALLGTEHVLREFRIEATRRIKDPLLAGLDNADFAFFDSTVIAPWSGQRLVSRDVYTYCVDGEDIAPFCFGPPNPDFLANHRGGPDGTPYNVVNGLYSDDFWWYIYQMGYDAIPPDYTLLDLRLPVAARLKKMTIWNNAFYDTLKDCELLVDGQIAAKVELPDAAEAVSIDLHGLDAREGLKLVAKSVRHRQDRRIMGIDEISILRELPPWYQGRVFPLDTVGGLVRYPRGKGGFLLNQFKLHEKDLRDNVQKKRRIVAIILQNLGAAYEE